MHRYTGSSRSSPSRSSSSSSKLSDPVSDRHTSHIPFHRPIFHRFTFQPSLDFYKIALPRPCHVSARPKQDISAALMTWNPLAESKLAIQYPSCTAPAQLCFWSISRDLET
jgi:hypothetical protein